MNCKELKDEDPGEQAIPLPSLIHYELVLQLLERQTLLAADRTPAIREQVRQLIVTLRKALAQHKRLEESCEQADLAIEYRWSLNTINNKSNSTFHNS
jgi:predicted ATPase